MAHFSSTSMNTLLREILTIKRPAGFPSTTDKVEMLLKEQLGFADRDEFGNFIYRIGLVTHTAFMCHYDTAESEAGCHKLNLQRIKQRVSVRGGGVLGADCGAGIYLMIRMMQAKVPGVYCFFADEELGRIGSIAYRIQQGAPRGCFRAISFDRKGYSDVITHQFDEEGCSLMFANALASELNRHITTYPLYQPSPKGSFTDSYSFFDCIPECTNISVGYFNGHQQNEFLDYRFVEQLLTAILSINYESLPVNRKLPAREVIRYDMATQLNFEQ